MDFDMFVVMKNANTRVVLIQNGPYRSGFVETREKKFEVGRNADFIRSVT